MFWNCHSLLIVHLNNPNVYIIVVSLKTLLFISRELHVHVLLGCICLHTHLNVHTCGCTPIIKFVYKSLSLLWLVVIYVFQIVNDFENISIQVLMAAMTSKLLRVNIQCGCTQFCFHFWPFYIIWYSPYKSWHRCGGR